MHDNGKERQVELPWGLSLKGYCKRARHRTKDKECSHATSRDVYTEHFKPVWWTEYNSHTTCSVCSDVDINVVIRPSANFNSVLTCYFNQEQYLKLYTCHHVIVLPRRVYH